MGTENRKITATEAIKTLEKYGTIITSKDAEVILDFIYLFSKLAINQGVISSSVSNTKLSPSSKANAITDFNTQ